MGGDDWRLGQPCLMARVIIGGCCFFGAPGMHHDWTPLHLMGGFSDLDGLLGLWALCIASLVE